MFGGGIDARDKTGARDLVTEADLASERLILQFISERHPEHGWQSEEAGSSGGASPLYWVIDPLDGTANFAHGYPQFAVSVALMHQGRSIAGAVYDPLRDECFDAALGCDASLNGSPIRVSTVTALDRALVSTGFPYAAERRRAVADLTARAIERVQMLRRSGSAALDCAYVAAGRSECHWEFILNLHDVAAGLLLVQEAGGIGEELQAPGWPLGYIVSGTRSVRDAIVAMIHECFGRVDTRPAAPLAGGM
jgi:myo-inositol-1(or 4)-monophosphatase